MERRHYSKELKDKAVKMFLEGISSHQIAKEFNLQSPDLVRKWVQFWRKENNVTVTNYRRSDIINDVDEKMSLLHKIDLIEKERDLAIQTLKLVCSGNIEGWEELLTYIKNKN